MEDIGRYVRGARPRAVRPAAPGVSCLLAPLLGALVTGSAVTPFAWSGGARRSGVMAVPAALALLSLAVDTNVRSECR